jgi:hypothetical protein
VQCCWQSGLPSLSKLFMDVEMRDLTVDVSLRFTRRWKIIAPFKKKASRSRD